MLQVVIGIDVDDLIERTEFGMPEGSQLGVLLAQREPLLIALLEFGQGSGAQGVGADFVDHRHILPG
jgi:hypothetical protein